MAENSKRSIPGKKLLLVAALLGIGLWGSVFFFPMNLGNNHTCLYHRMICPRHSLMAETRPADRPLYRHGMSDSMHGQLVNRYVMPFGFLWWGSLGLLAFGVYSIKKISQKSGKEPHAVRHEKY